MTQPEQLRKSLVLFGAMASLAGLYSIWMYSNSPFINKVLISVLYILFVPVVLALFYKISLFLLRVSSKKG
jgi:apolipoprotein N-acyltransferase